MNTLGVSQLHRHECRAPENSEAGPVIVYGPGFVRDLDSGIRYKYAAFLKARYDLLWQDEEFLDRRLRSTLRIPVGAVIRTGVHHSVGTVDKASSATGHSRSGQLAHARSLLLRREQARWKVRP